MNLKSLPKKVKNALVTIKDFCVKQLNTADDDTEYCLKCPFYDDELNECYFGVETPDNWEVEE
jgi:hypothetical protein